MKSFGLAMMFTVLPGISLAGETTCYKRVYDSAHMQKHKLQEVSKIQLKMEQNGAESAGNIKAAFKELPNFLSSKVTCIIKQKVTACEVENNGGSFTFVATVKGIKLTNTSKIRFGGEDDGVTVGREAEHREFFMFKTVCDD
jgi:hypothetical protein